MSQTIDRSSPLPSGASLAPGLDPAGRAASSAGAPWTLALFGLALALLYGPTVWSLSNSLWQDDTHSHGPIVLAVVAWLLARGIRFQLDQTPVALRAPGQVGLGSAWVGLGLLAYAVGRSQSLYLLEVGSALPVVLGLVVLVFGTGMARKLWFPLFFMLFLVPLPGSFIDTITHPMKLGVSWASEHLLHLLGYPVGRQGVILSVGQYQLFVADACAGLNSLFMLEAFGLLYLNVVRHESALRNVALAVLIVPISFVSNVVRVCVLALVTYHHGDAAGQGFVHGFSGMVLFGVALMLTIGADTVVRGAVRAWRSRRGFTATREDDAGTPTPGLWPAVRSWAGVKVPLSRAAGMALAALAVATLAWAATPQPQPGTAAGDLEALIPRQFGDWTLVNRPMIPVDVVASEPGETNLNNPYDQVVMRVYRNAAGDVVDLAVAYGAHQRQEVKIHQPELCFTSQGFRIAGRSPTQFSRPAGNTGPAITGQHLYTESGRANVAVSYWIRIGTIYADSAWETRWHIFSQGLKGRATDGVLVRATTRVAGRDEAPAAQARMDAFLEELLRAGSPELRRALAR